MIHNTYIFYDFETGSRNANKTQPIQLAAVAIHSRKLEIIPGSEFNSMICALEDDEAIAKGVDPLQDEALKVNKKTREEIFKAPHAKVVWGQFTDYVNSFNYKKNKWAAPIKVGFNNCNFDDVIVNRLSEEYGPYDKEYQKENLFHPFHSIDLMKIVFNWFENNDEMHRMNMDSLRDYLGMNKDNAHDALQDVIDGAKVFIKFMNLHRNYAKKVRFKGAFSNEV